MTPNQTRSLIIAETTTSVAKAMNDSNFTARVAKTERLKKARLAQEEFTASNSMKENKKRSAK